MKWYGSVTNRIEERMESKKPEIGMGVTEYLYSDCNAYEITKVVDDKHFFMRRYDVKNKGGYGSNDWELISNPNGYEYEMIFRYGHWYQAIKYTKESIEKALKEDGFIIIDPKTKEQAMKKGFAYKYDRKNIVIGHADYYYDYSF